MKRAVAAIAIVALLVVVATAGVAVATDQHGSRDSVAALTTTVRFRSVAVQQPARPFPLHGAFAALVALTALGLAGTTLRSRRHLLIGPERRRIGDVGDDWRALLLGAPPHSV
jgi:hypothetical protein